MSEIVALVILLILICLELLAILAILRTTGWPVNSGERGRGSAPRPARSPAASPAVSEPRNHPVPAPRHRPPDPQGIGFHPGPIRRPYGPAGLPTPDDRWGPAILRPDWIPVLHGQKICIICQKPIDLSYQHTGWVRCEQTDKLVHGHCFQEWLRAGRRGCPSCNRDHGLSRVLL